MGRTRFLTFANAVSDHAKLAVDLEAFWLQKRQGLEESSNECSTAFVSVHASHMATMLDISTTSVIGDTLADQEQSRVDGAFLRLIGELDDPALVSWNNFKYHEKFKFC